ncbi:MAG: UDP-N-acetylmuramate:L-alanyl-gamma-D-glutamyl-meso-diaminopimelate ligase [Betaproteobacteria bacterium]
MHIHIVGICGTFMGGLATVARSAGHQVTGCDANVYPPMSTQLQAQGIELIEGFDADQIQLKPDLFIIGNVVSRGNPLMEAILNARLHYTSGPQWLAQSVLQKKWVLAVAGTHGKTTTTSMLAWMLEYAKLEPGFLIGGVSQNFGLSARLSQSNYFVIEADEYDTAFFDKRSKFVHYHPRTLILNNLEFDHADIFADLSAIETQFHHLVRTVPGEGRIVCHGKDQNLKRVLERGCWTPVTYFASPEGWQAVDRDQAGFGVLKEGVFQGRVQWDLIGEHNISNALAAMIAATELGVKPQVAIEALSTFKNVKRRMELKAQVAGVNIYDDFAHHPTAIKTTIQGLREKIGKARLIAVLEPRSNTLKQGVLKEQLADSLNQADAVFCYSAGLAWDVGQALSALGDKLTVETQFETLLDRLSGSLRPGDFVLIMSNGGFNGLHGKLIERLTAKALNQ